MKKNIKKVIFSVLVLGLNVCHGQYFTNNEKTDFYLPILNNAINYTIYPENLIIRGLYKSQNESLNKFPEEVLVSTLSATNFQWEQSNYTYQIKENLKKYSSKIKPTILLKRKLSFSFNDTDYAIIKFYLNEKDSSEPSSFILVKKNNRWRITDEVNLSKIDLMFTYLKSSALDAIFLNHKLFIRSFDSQVELAHKNGFFDLNVAINSNPSNEMPKEEIKEIIESKFLN